MTRVFHCGWLIGVTMLGLACGTDRPTSLSSARAALTAPSAVQPPQTNARPPQPVPEVEPVAIYVFRDSLDYPVQHFTTVSKYLFYGNGVFGLQYEDSGYVYWGTYQTDDAHIIFWFSADRIPDEGDATGTLRQDLLEVRYSEMMQHSDFDNAVYRRTK